MNKDLKMKILPKPDNCPNCGSKNIGSRAYECGCTLTHVPTCFDCGTEIREKKCLKHRIRDKLGCW